MPYASTAQRGYLHAHPEITDKKGRSVAAKWDAEIRRKKRVKKRSAGGAGWLKPLAIGTAGGALANQLPSFEEQQRLRENRRRRKARVKELAKRQPEWPDDGFFNARAAQRIYDLVMKMDRDSAEMFCTIVVSEAMEADIEANRRTLQAHLDEVVAKRFTDLKRATMRAVKKDGDDDGLAFAQALAVLEEVSKARLTPQDYGWVFREEDIRRDPTTGQFQTKIKRTQTKPIHDRTAAAMGIPTHTEKTDGGKSKPTEFTPEQKAQYQDEYRQLANFLNMVHESVPNAGDHRIEMQFEDHDGNRWVERKDSTRPRPKDLDPRDRKLIGVRAHPEALNLGGMAFGLAGALGGQPTNPMRLAQLNALQAGMPDFARDWTKDYSTSDTNARLYGRTAAGGKLLAQVAPEASKAELAGHIAQFAGQFGPQAEAVIGPPARRTAYRYRGTEKKPDAAMVQAYEANVRTAMARRGYNEADNRASKLAQNRALKAKRDQLAEERKVPVEAVRLTDAERAEAQNSAKKAVADRGNAPTWEEQNAGAAEIAEYLKRPADDPRGGAAPRKGLYNLQLASGNTPPSEGVILDRDGRIVTQAVGYGDDHYLPFNLKNLKGLKGGQYIRNRSVGGLTSEDIYTGLMSGARRVTVVSRSGTFTMEFEPDFRGARRHNDKAARMTRRYEHLLDAVQSEQVERQDINPDMRRAITQRVHDEAEKWPLMYPDAKSKRLAIQRKVEEYKSNPDWDPEDDANLDLVTNYHTAGLPIGSAERNAVRSELRNKLAAEKEQKFRLNGQGYADALQSLQEQFPYYIKVKSVPTKEGRHETELDRGYVEPRRIRPTAATVGLFGNTKLQSPHAGVGGKVSAATADYARPFIPVSAARVTEETTAAEGAEGAPEGTAGATAGGTPGATPAATPEPDPVAQIGYVDQAVKLHAALKQDTQFVGAGDPGWGQLDEGQFRTYLENKENQRNFDEWVATHRHQYGSNSATYGVIGGYDQASGRIGQKLYEPALNQAWPPKPFRFADEGPAYKAGATQPQRYAEFHRIGATNSGVVNLKRLDQMSDEELRAEVLAVGPARKKMASLQGETDFEDRKKLLDGVNLNSPSLETVFASEDHMDKYLELVHRTRAINHGVPLAERGYQEPVEHNPVSQENTGAPAADQLERITDLTKQAMRAYPEGSAERGHLDNLLTDLESFGGQIDDPEEFSALPDAHPEAHQAIMLAIHHGRVVDKNPIPVEPEKARKIRSGAILS